MAPTCDGCKWISRRITFGFVCFSGGFLSAAETVTDGMMAKCLCVAYSLYGVLILSCLEIM